MEIRMVMEMSPVAMMIGIVIVVLYTLLLMIVSEHRLETELEPYSDALDEISEDLGKLQEDLKPILEALASSTNQDTKMILYAHKRIDMIVEELKNARRKNRSQRPG